MKLIGLCPVRNEDWVAGLSLRVALLYCDGLVVLDHASTDGTAEILKELQHGFPGRVKVIHESKPDWAEMEHRQRLLEAARDEGATHMAIIDADEFLSANLLQRIRSDIEETPPGWGMQLPIYNCRGSMTRYHATGVWSHRWATHAFCDSPALNWQGDRFHHREPFGLARGIHQPVLQGRGGIIHLWGASERRLVAKHMAYRITERLRWPAKAAAEIEFYYRMATDGVGGDDVPDRWRYAEMPEEWISPYSTLMSHLDLDAAPWQEAFCNDAIDRHGLARFAGLRVRKT